MPDNTSIELRSEQVQDILEAIPNWMILWGNTLIMLLIIMLLCMSWFVKYPDIINANATVTTETPPQKIYGKITGKLSALLVSDNEKVKASQPLAIIENSANYQDVFLLKHVLDTITVNKKTINFPIDRMPILFLGDIDTQYALFENNYIQYKLNKELQPFSNEALANQYSISELHRRLQSSKSQRQINKKELEFKNKELQRHKSLFDKGVISAQDYESRQLEYAQAERNYKNFETSISQIKESISTAQKTLKGSKINQIKDEMSLLKNVIQSLNQLKNAIKVWEQMYVLQSAINGQVSFLNYYSTNQTINQGDLVFTIIPNESSTFIAKLKTPAQNSGKIKLDQTVNIKVDNFPKTEFGVLKGKVTYISAIPNKEGLYLVNVELPKELITSYNKKIEFKQEMLGSAEIITEDLRLIERFFYQLRNVLNR